LNTKDEILKIATCSDDGTVRLWNFKTEDFDINNQFSSGNNSNLVRKIPHIDYSKITRRIIYFNKNYYNFKLNIDELTGEATNANLDNFDEVEISTVK